MQNVIEMELNFMYQTYFDKTYGVFVYADETHLEIERKKHTIIGGIIPDNPAKIMWNMIKLKETIGLNPFDEVKWNMKGLDESRRLQLSEGIINILNEGCNALITLVEGNDKSAAARLFANQVYDYCNEKNIETFSLFMDENLVSHIPNYVNFLKTNFIKNNAKCSGMNNLISQYDQIIQCCDIFTGLYRCAIINALKDDGKTVFLEDEIVGSIEELKINDYIILKMRYLVWGAVEEVSDINGIFSYKNSIGFGVRIFSTISEESARVIKEKVAMTFIGSMY
jgi:hypothetical protein